MNRLKYLVSYPHPDGSGKIVEIIIGISDEPALHRFIREHLHHIAKNYMWKRYTVPVSSTASYSWTEG